MIYIRDLKSEDVYQIVKYLDGLDTIDFLEWETEDFIKTAVTQNKGISKIAINKESNSIVGFIFGGDTGFRGVLHHLYIIPEYRKSGLGTKLVKECINSFKTKPSSSRRIFGLVYGNNNAAIQILKNNGFTLNPELDKQYPFVVPLYIDLKND